MLPAVLNSKDSNNFYYTIRIPFLAAGDTEILIYSADTDNSNNELTFHEYYNFKNGFPNGWQSGRGGFITSASIFNNIAWKTAGSQPTTDGWIKDANTDYIRHQSNSGFLITNDLTTNQEAEGYTYEFIAEFEHSTFWSFGFGSRDYINSDNVRTFSDNGSKLYLQNADDAVIQSIPVVSGVMYKIKIAISIYADRVNYKGWSSDNVLLFDRTFTRALSETNNDSRSRIKFWGGDAESRFYQLLKRKNAIGGTYTVVSIPVTAPQWLTHDDYNLLFPSYPIAEGAYDEYERSAVEDINFITSDKINKIGLDNLEEWKQHRVRRAVGYQVMFYAAQGGLYDLTEIDYNSASVGKFSIAKGTANANPNIQPFTINGRQVSPKIRELLMGTGLLYAGVKGV